MKNSNKQFVEAIERFRFGYYDKSGLWRGDKPPPNGLWYDKTKDTGYRSGKLPDANKPTEE